MSALSLVLFLFLASVWEWLEPLACAVLIALLAWTALAVLSRLRRRRRHRNSFRSP